MGEAEGFGEGPDGDERDPARRGVGEAVRRSRETRAMARRTDFGRELIAAQWAAAEFGVLAHLWQLTHGRPGTTRAYADVAAAIGDPKALRAVGMAAASNPAVLVVPCHRVLARVGSLHGFSGGIERKRWLLVHEGALLA